MLLRSIILPALIFIVSSGPLYAGKGMNLETVGAPGKFGFSESGLAAIRQSFEETIAAGEIAGMVGLLARDGKIVFHEALGMRDREAGVPMTLDTIFYIASLTKIVTSAAVMILVEEGKLDLDDPVAKYLPSFGDMQVLEKDGDGYREVKPRRPMTIRHLLTHTAGLTYGWTKDRVDQLLYEKEVLKDNATVGQMVEKMPRIPLKYHPGEVWEYSYATDVAGYIIEVVSEMTLDGFLHERIFKPLGMRDTAFEPAKDKWQRVSAGYKLEDGKAVRSEGRWSTKEVERRKNYFSGGGGLTSTAQDYYIFMQMLLDGGKYGNVRILKKKSIKAMTANQLPKGSIVSEHFPWVGNRGFGLGLSIYDAPDSKGVIHSWSGSTGTFAWINIPKKMVGVFMVHIGDGKFRQRFGQLAHSALID